MSYSTNHIGKTDFTSRKKKGDLYIKSHIEISHIMGTGFPSGQIEMLGNEMEVMVA